MFVRTIDVKSKDEETCVRITQESVGDVSCVVWDAALVLIKYLEVAIDRAYLEANDFSNIVELGSGTGCVGIAAGALGGNVVITDLPSCLPLMNKNIVQNSTVIKGNVCADALVWGEDVGKFAGDVTLILLSDCLYYQQSVEPLVSTLVGLSGSTTKLLMSYEIRDDKREIYQYFFDLMKEKFTWEEIPRSKQHPDYYSHDIVVLSFIRNGL